MFKGLSHTAWMTWEEVPSTTIYVYAYCMQSCRKRQWLPATHGECSAICTQLVGLHRTANHLDRGFKGLGAYIYNVLASYQSALTDREMLSVTDASKILALATLIPLAFKVIPESAKDVGKLLSSLLTSGAVNSCHVVHS